MLASGTGGREQELMYKKGTLSMIAADLVIRDFLHVSSIVYSQASR
jgi:hypothetical protein